jgi:hypothetical protein
VYLHENGSFLCVMRKFRGGNRIEDR